MSDNFKEAKRIELHDTGVTIYQKDYDCNVHANWGEWDTPTGTSYLLEADALKTIADILGVDVRIKDTDEVRLIKERQSVGSSSESNIHGGQEIIKALFAQVVASNLLSIRMTFDCAHSDDAEDITQEITFSGNFTVWWK